MVVRPLIYTELSTHGKVPYFDVFYRKNFTRKKKKKNDVLHVKIDTFKKRLFLVYLSRL